MQTTIQNPVAFTGVGLHSGMPSYMTIKPAKADAGIIVRRLDAPVGQSEIEARWDNVEQSPLCTKLVNKHGTEVSTTEHVLAALAGCGIHNAVIEMDGPELPILDGSSVEFVRGILQTGIKKLDAPVKAIKILKQIEVKNGDAYARISPHETLLIDFQIDFNDPAIGVQKKRLNMSNGSFVRELSTSRTFCQMSDVDNMRAQGLALGGTLENAVVVDAGTVLTPGGLRHADEAVRHKMLDALGDLALAGAPILGHYEGHLAGHALTNILLRQVFADPNNYKYVVCDDQIAAKLPGAGVHINEMPEVA